MITTEGHRDGLEIGRESRYDLYDLDLEVPAPLVPRRWRRGVRERVLADGEVRTPLDVDAVRAAARRMAGEGVTSFAVVFLHSYRHDAHERAAAEAIAAECPRAEVTTSVEVLPQLGELERASTTVANAYVRPLMSDYLGRLEHEVGAVAGAPLALLTSSGRLTPAMCSRSSRSQQAAADGGSDPEDIE